MTRKKKDTSFLESFGETLKTKCRQDEPPFCTVACPFHLDIKEMEPKWESGRWNAVYRSFQTSVGFPEIVSALCPRPCEENCILKTRGGSLKIGEIERAVLRLAKRKAPNAYNLPPKPQRIAVIGGGLSGLGCALRLCNKKYQVTVFEKTEVLGGTARCRMNEVVFDEEIRNQFQFETPELCLGTEVTGTAGERTSDAEGQNQQEAVVLSFQEIRSGFDAVYIATGKDGNCFGMESSPDGAFASTVPGVFLGGALTGADEITALAQGLRAAMAVERYLKTGLMNEPEDRTDTKLVLDPARIPEAQAVAVSDPDTGYSAEEVSKEAVRCRKCSCDICVRECDLMRIQQKTPGRLYEEAYITVRPSTLANDGRWATRRIASCDQCGLCRTVCPQRIDMGEFLLQSHRGLKETDAMPWAFHDYWLRDMEFSRTEACLVKTPEGMEQSSYALFPGCQMAASDPLYVKEAYRWMRDKAPDTALWLNCCGAPAVWGVEDELHAAHLEDLKSQWEKLGKPTVVFTCPTCRKMFDAYLPDISGVFLEELMADWGLPEQAAAKAEPKTAAPGDLPFAEGEQENRPEPEEGERIRFAVFDPCASRDYPGLQKAVRVLADRAGIPHEDLSHTGDMARCCSFGGQYSIAAPDYAKRVRMERAEESPLPYITYCVNCRDTFASRGKENLHILDLVFGRRDRRRENPTVTARWENRRRLKEELLREYWGEEPPGEEKILKLLVEPELERKLSEQHILVSDMEEVVEACEAEGAGVLHGNGHITTHKKLQHMTYWAEYEPLPDGSFRLWNGYVHRMNLEGE